MLITIWPMYLFLLLHPKPYKQVSWYFHTLVSISMQCPWSLFLTGTWQRTVSTCFELLMWKKVREESRESLKWWWKYHLHEYQLDLASSDMVPIWKSCALLQGTSSSLMTSIYIIRELKDLRKYVCKQLLGCLWAELFPPSHSWQVSAAQLLSKKATLQRWFSAWSFPIFQLLTPRKFFVLLTQTDKAGEGRSLWHCLLEWLPVSLLFLPHRQSLRLAQETHNPFASFYPCHPCSKQGISAPLLQGPGPETPSPATAAHRRGKRSPGEDSMQEAVVPQGGDNDPNPKPSVTLHAHPLGLCGTMYRTTRSSGALPGWLLAV